MDLVGWLMYKQLKFHCHCNIPEYTRLLNMLKFLIGQMFMHVYISHSICAITLSISYNINPSKKIVQGKVINIYTKMYQMTLFLKK